jgi:hypothetical protein
VGTKPSVSVLWLTHGQCFACRTMRKSTDFPFVGITQLIFIFLLLQEKACRPTSSVPKLPACSR